MVTVMVTVTRPATVPVTGTRPVTVPVTVTRSATVTPAAQAGGRRSTCGGICGANRHLESDFF